LVFQQPFQIFVERRVEFFIKSFGLIAVVPAQFVQHRRARIFDIHVGDDGIVNHGIDAVGQFGVNAR